MIDFGKYYEEIVSKSKRHENDKVCNLPLLMVCRVAWFGSNVESWYNVPQQNR